LNFGGFKISPPLDRNLLNFFFIYKLDYLLGGLNNPIDPQKRFSQIWLEDKMKIIS
jgi:hypothetical protein